MRRKAALLLFVASSCMTTDRPAIEPVPAESTDRCQLTQYRFEQEYQSRKSERNALSHGIAVGVFGVALFLGPDILLGIPIVYLRSGYLNHDQKAELNDRLISEFCKEPEPFGDPG